MVIIYYNKSDASSKKAFSWLDKHKIKYCKYSIKKNIPRTSHTNIIYDGQRYLGYVKEKM